MIANAGTIVIGLWLVYRAVFVILAGNLEPGELATAGTAVANSS